jgi:DNA-binding MarR family transcriptional regulator
LTIICPLDNLRFVNASAHAAELTAHSEPDTLVSELLSQLNTVAIRLHTRTRKPGPHSRDLSIAEHAVLEMLVGATALTVPQIARERSTSRQNIQILIDRLEMQGRVEIIQNPAHRRSGLVRLTDAGKAWLRQTEPNHQRLLSEIAAGMSESELHTALSVLRKVHNLLSSGTGAPSSAETVTLRRQGRTSRAPQQKQRSEPMEGTVEEFPVSLL